jgi:dienelactone hydrolase
VGLVAACAQAAPQSAEPPAPVEPVGVDFSGRGPYPVGVIDLRLGDRSVVVLYPADEGSVAGSEHRSVHSTQSGLPVDAQAFVPPALALDVPGDVYLGPAVNAEGPFPLVLYSHATAQGNRSAAAQLEHLASWGFIAVAPQHHERDVMATVTGRLTMSGDPDVRDLRNTIEMMRRENTRSDSVLLGSIDLDRVGAIGHLEGGRAVARLAIESPAVDAWIGLAPVPPVPLTADGQIDRSEVAVTFALAATPPPPQPSLVVAPADYLVTERGLKALTDWLVGSDQLVLLANAGGASFTDACSTIRSRGGLLQFAAYVPVAPEVLAALEEGCTDGRLDPALASRVVRHLEVAHLRWAFGFDETRASLDPGFIQSLFPDAIVPA